MIAFGRRLGIEPADVLRDRAREQFDILRQIADMAAEHVGRPLIERRAVEPHLAADRLPDADQRAHQRRLARSARPDHAEAVAGLERESDVLDDDPLIARRHDADALDRQPARRALQQGLRGSRRHLFQQAVEPVPALPRGDETFPVRDRQIDRRQRPRAQDRARDDDARRWPPGGSRDRRRPRAPPIAASCASPWRSRRGRRRRRWRAGCPRDISRWPRSSAWSAAPTCPSPPALRRCAGWRRRDRCGAPPAPSPRAPARAT